MSVVPPTRFSTVAASLDIGRTGPGRFRSHPHDGAPTRSFGGEVASQAVVAASRTVPADRPIHSAHMYFLAPGDTSMAVDYDVTVLRDGGSFSARQVTAAQSGRAIFTMTASFQVAEPGLSHAIAGPPVPAPGDLPAPEQMLKEQPEALRWLSYLLESGDLDMRFARPPVRAAALRGEATEPRQQVWLRSRTAVPQGQAAHAAGLAYVSDLLLLSTALGPHVVSGPLQIATVNHTIWFHHPLRVDEWFLYDQESTWADGGRALVHGRIFDLTGRLCASTAQEGLLRVQR